MDNDSEEDIYYELLDACRTLLADACLCSGTQHKLTEIRKLIADVDYNEREGERARREYQAGLHKTHIEIANEKRESRGLPPIVEEALRKVEESEARREYDAGLHLTPIQRANEKRVAKGLPPIVEGV